MKRFPLLVVFMLCGCLSKPQVGADSLWSGKEASGPALQYLGVGGWLIPWHGEGVLIAPSFSNPALLHMTGVPPIFVSPDKKRITSMMPDASFVSMLLVGHAHYDHLLDVPEIFKNYTPNAQLYGSETVINIMKKQYPGGETRYHNVLKDIASVSNVTRPGDRGNWITSEKGYIRVKPIRSMHAGHLGSINLLPGIDETQPEKPLNDIWDWKLGTPIAWLIDLLDSNQKTVYRIHFQDSAATPPWGFPPVEPDGKRIDVEIICAGDWDHVNNYPAALLDYNKPRMVLIGHWENFFGNDPGDVRIIPFMDLRGLVDISRRHSQPGAAVYTPLPFTKIALPTPE